MIFQFVCPKCQISLVLVTRLMSDNKYSQNSYGFGLEFWQSSLSQLTIPQMTECRYWFRIPRNENYAERNLHIKVAAVSTAMTQQHNIDSNELYVCWISSCWLTYLLALLLCWVRSAILDKYSFLFFSSLIWCRSSVIWCSNNLVFDLALPLVTIIKTLGRIEREVSVGVPGLIWIM